MGLTLAWHCLNLGASVRVIDPNGIANGASGGIVGALAPHVPVSYTHLPSPRDLSTSRMPSSA